MTAISRQLLLLLTLLLALVLSAPAQEGVAGYLQTTDPLLSAIARLDREYRDSLPDLRQKRDLLGIHAYISEQGAAWSSLGRQLTKLSPPEECVTYHGTLAKLVDLQLVRNTLALELSEGALLLTADVKALKEGGATQDSIQSRLDQYKTEAELLNARRDALQGEVNALDASRKAEHARLTSLPMVSEPSSTAPEAPAPTSEPTAQPKSEPDLPARPDSSEQTEPSPAPPEP